ncbi:DUF3592 domain-containing protein [Kitasatospora nipponensis]
MPHDLVTVEGWTDVPPLRSSATRSPLGSRRLLVALVVGPLLAALGLAFVLHHVVLWRDFRGAARVPAVITDAEYVKPELLQDPSRMRVSLAGDGGPDEVVIDRPGSAPGRLRDGDRVVVLYSAARPGHAVFPQQLGMGELVLPVGFVAIGLSATVSGGLSLLGRHRGPRRGRV